MPKRKDRRTVDPSGSNGAFRIVESEPRYRATNTRCRRPQTRST